MKGFIKTLILAASFLAIPAFAGQPVNVNAADAQELAEGLDGVGASKAQAIIAYRSEHGPFKHADELVNVKGIGLRTVEKNREFILTSDGKRAQASAAKSDER